MAKYPNKSLFTPKSWEKIVEALTLLHANNISTTQLSIDSEWRGIPIGKYLESIRQARCENKLTQEEMKVLKEFLYFPSLQILPIGFQDDRRIVIRVTEHRVPAKVF